MVQREAVLGQHEEGAAGEDAPLQEATISADTAKSEALSREEADSLPLSDEARQRLERREAALAKRAAESPAEDGREPLGHLAASGIRGLVFGGAPLRCRIVGR